MSTIGGLISDLCFIETLLIVARVLMSWFPCVDYGNPLVRGLLAVTDPVLRIFRPILPTFAGLDLSPLLAILVLRVVGNTFGHLGDGFSITFVLVDLVKQLLLALLVIMIIIVFLRVVMTIFQADPWHTTTRMVRDMARPLTSPFNALAIRSKQWDVPAIAALVFYIVAYFVIRRVFDEILIHVV
jgi:YggT family protein